MTKTFEENLNNHKLYVEKYMLEKMGIESLENLSIEDKTRLTKEFILCIMSECDEILRELPWKFWKNKVPAELNNVNQENVEFEIIDLQHFVNNIYFLWNMDANRINSIFSKKLEINVERAEKAILSLAEQD